MDVTHENCQLLKEKAVRSPKMSAFNSHHSKTPHNTLVFIYTPVRNSQRNLTLNCFNLHYETCTNYNLMAIEFYNLILWKIYS